MQNTIQSATEPCWRVVELLQLTPEEAGGRHHVLVDVLDDDGKDLRGQVTIRYGWDGMQPEETPQPMTLDKPANEPGASIPVWPGQNLWVEVDGEIPSDRAAGFDAYGCYYVQFLLTI